MPRGHRWLLDRKDWKVVSSVAGQWCSLIVMKKWSHCTGCMVQRRQSTRVQRTINRAELTAFLCLPRKVIGPIKVHVDNKGIIDGWPKGKRVHQAKSGRCRFMDENVGRTTWSGRKKHFGGSGTCIGAQYEESKEKTCRSLRSLSRKAMRRKMTWQKQEQCWTKDSWQKHEQRQRSRKEREVNVALQYAASFDCLVEEWKDGEELRPKLIEKWSFIDQQE